MALYTVWYDFVKPHLRTSPALAAGVAEK